MTTIRERAIEEARKRERIFVRCSERSLYSNLGRTGFSELPRDEELKRRFTLQTVQPIRKHGVA